MAMITAMSTKGQIVLPKKIRSALNLDAGTQFIVFSDRGEHSPETDNRAETLGF